MKVFCASTNISPVSHQLGTVGNESIVNVEDVRTPLGSRKVPVLSGNAIRHRMIRAPGADYLIDALGLHGKLSRDVLNLLYHGGIKREKGKSPSLARIADMHRLFPLLRLLGACLPEAIVAGELTAHRAMLACRENQSRINAIAPKGWEFEGHLAPATSFIERWQYVRGVMKHSLAHSATDTTDKDESTMMPFAGTCVIPGAVWVHGFSMSICSQIEFGCLLHCLRKWDADGATIGGQSSRGHGILQLSIWTDAEFDHDESISAYEEHVDDNKGDCVEFLRGCYS
jgi:hypothetical protein